MFCFVVFFFVTVQCIQDCGNYFYVFKIIYGFCCNVHSVEVSPVLRNGGNIFM